MGPVTNVVLFDKEPSGVASVRYSTVEAAEACVKVCSTFQVSSVLSIQKTLCQCSLLFMLAYAFTAIFLMRWLILGITIHGTDHQLTP